MIFVNSKKTATYLKDKLTQESYAPGILIGGMPFEERDKTIDGFRSNIYTHLVASNVLARGIDIPQVDIVVNFDVPTVSNNFYLEPDFANYLHRIGRTGRFGTDGLAITFVEQDEDGLQESMMRKMEEFYKSEIKEITLPEFIVVFKAMRPYLYGQFGF